MLSVQIQTLVLVIRILELAKIYILEENICPIQLSFSCYISLLISNIRSASETEPDSIIKDAKKSWSNLTQLIL